MSIATIPLPPAQCGFLERFTTACAANVRVLAALLSGSYARGSADAYSDLDLGIIVSDGTTLCSARIAPRSSSQSL